LPALPVPTPVIAPPIGSAPVIAAAIITPIVPARICATCIAQIVATRIITAIIAASKFITTPIAPVCPAVSNPVSSAIAAILNAIGPSLTAVLNPIGAEIAATLDLIGPCLGSAINALRCAISAAPVKLIGTKIAALFDFSGPEFAAAINLLSARVIAALDPVGTSLRSVFGLLSPLGLLRLTENIGPKSARLARILTGLGVLLTLLPIAPRFGTPASVAAAVCCALGAGFATSRVAPSSVILRRGSGGNGKGKRQRQSCQRSTLCKNRHHPRDSKVAGPPQAAC
jgi:hypothetical protein